MAIPLTRNSPVEFGKNGGSGAVYSGFVGSESKALVGSQTGDPFGGDAVAGCCCHDGSEGPQRYVYPALDAFFSIYKINDLSNQRQGRSAEARPFITLLFQALAGNTGSVYI